MKQESLHEIDMANGPIFAGMVRFALPLAASSILQLLFNAADVIVIGRFSTSASLAAVGTDGLLTGLFANLLLNLAVGSTVLTSNYLGAGKTEKVHSAVHVSMALALVTGLAFTAVMFFLSSPVLRMLKTPDEVMPAALQYLYFYLPGLPGVAVYNFGAALLRAKGDTKRPFFFLLVSGIINVFLNLFFVLVAHMDVAGVALATTISQYIATGLLLACMFGEHDAFKLDIHEIHFDNITLADILRIGVPSALQCLIFFISNFVIQASVNSFGTVTMAGSAASSNIEMFVWVCMCGFEQAGMTYISRNLGAAKYDRIDRANRLSLLATVVTGIVLGLTVALFSVPLLHLYTPDDAAVAQGTIRLRIICGTYATCGIMDCLSGNIRGLGYSMLPSIVTIGGVCVLRLVWIFTAFRHPAFHTLESLFAVYPGSWIVTGAVLAVCYAVIRRRL